MYYAASVSSPAGGRGVSAEIAATTLPQHQCARSSVLRAINRPGHIRPDSSPAFSASVSASRNSRSAWNQNSSSLPDGRPFSSQISRARRRIRFLVGFAKMLARHCSFSESADMRSAVSQSLIQRVKLRYFLAFARTLLTSCLRFMQTNEARLRIVHSRGQGEGSTTEEWQDLAGATTLSRVSAGSRYRGKLIVSPAPFVA
jgi:hypothetical protein